MITALVYVAMFLFVAGLIFASEKWVFGTDNKESIKVALIFGTLGTALGLLLTMVI
jgi:hypothetical protein